MRKSILDLKLRQAVDKDLATRIDPKSFAFCALPVLCALLLKPYVTEFDFLLVLSFSLIVGAVWGIYLFWRYTRIFRAYVLLKDREYDQKVKYTLSPEYHSSESVTQARQNRKKSETNPDADASVE